MLQTNDSMSLADCLHLRVAPPRPRPNVKKASKARLRAILYRLAAMRGEALSLIVPLPHAEPFHACQKKVVIADGGNQAAKTFTVAVEVARALTNTDPYNKYPKGGLAIFVGYDEDHLADPMYKKLFKPGEFKLIRDEHTGLLRSVRPDPANPKQLDPYDLAYKEKWIDAPPLIPERFLKRPHAWEDTAKEVPRVTELNTGWRILWRASGGKPPQGVQAALIWADEEIKHTNLWVNELIPRLVKMAGKFLWSATPREGGPELYELRLKADNNSPYVSRFTFLIDDNPYMSAEEKAALLALWTSTDEIAVRYYGEYALVGRQVYGTYDPFGLHGCEPRELPVNWCRYAVVDPGTSLCATLLLAVDPDEQHVWVYDGFTLRNADANDWAYTLKEREHNIPFQGIIMDERAGNQKSFNAAQTTAQRFSGALDAADVQVLTGGPMSGFFPGTPDLKARTLALRSWLAPRSEGPFVGTPRLQVFKGCCPELDRQIKNAVSDKNDPDKRQKFEGQTYDLLDCLEYAAGADPRYYEPHPIEETRINPVVLDFLEQQQRRTKHLQLTRMLG